MAIQILNNITLAQAFPAVSQAQEKLSAAAQHIQEMKQDKESALNQINGKINALNGVLTDAQNLAQQSQALLTAAQTVLNNTDTILNNLSDALGSAGLYVIRYDGQAGNFGSELTTLLSELESPGETQMVSAQILLVTDANAWDALNSILKPFDGLTNPFGGFIEGGGG